jgi:hypothetical protein
MALGWAACLSSCVDNWLDEQPSDSVEAESAFNNSSDVNAARIGLYAALKGNSTSPYDSYYAAPMFYYGDVRGEDVQQNINGSGRVKSYYDFTYTGADNAPNMWQMPYIIIQRANQIINAAENATLSDRSDSTAAANIARMRRRRKSSGPWHFSI